MGSRCLSKKYLVSQHCRAPFQAPRNATARLLPSPWGLGLVTPSLGCKECRTDSTLWSIGKYGSASIYGIYGSSMHSVGIVRVLSEKTQANFGMPCPVQQAEINSFCGCQKDLSLPWNAWNRKEVRHLPQPRIRQAWSLGKSSRLECAIKIQTCLIRIISNPRRDDLEWCKEDRITCT